LLLDWNGKCQWIGRRHYRQSQPTRIVIAIEHREIHGRLAWLTYLMQRVGDNPDDFVIGVPVRNHVEVLAQWVFAREILLRQLTAYNDRLWAVGAIPARKKPPFQQRYLQCVEISGIGRAIERVWHRSAGRDRWMLGNRKRIILSGTRSWHHRS